MTIPSVIISQFHPQHVFCSTPLHQHQLLQSHYLQSILSSVPSLYDYEETKFNLNWIKQLCFFNVFKNPQHLHLFLHKYSALLLELVIFLPLKNLTIIASYLLLDSNVNFYDFTIKIRISKNKML